MVFTTGVVRVFVGGLNLLQAFPGNYVPAVCSPKAIDGLAFGRASHHQNLLHAGLEGTSR